MATLRHRNGTAVDLLAFCIAGRSPEAHVRLSSSTASFEHAAFHFLEERWYVRDLSSRNGTYVNGSPIPAGVRVALAQGDLVRFGDPREEWRVERMAPRPTSDHPHLVETSAVQRRVDLDEITLHFRTSPDEKDISVAFSIQGEASRAQLRARTGFRVLLYLARARLEDREREVPAHEEGWRPRAQILEELALSKNRLSVEAHRIRHLFEKHGVRDASMLIEYRRGSDTLRLGVASLDLDGWAQSPQP